MLIRSGQAEILRATQRDENFLKEYNERFSEIAQRVLGIRTWMKYREILKTSSEFIYYGLTTLMNIQTLGEEYTGILQTHSSGKFLQTRKVRLLMILLVTCGERVLIDTLKKFEKCLSTQTEDSTLKENVRHMIIKLSRNLQNIVPFLHKLHKAVFYLNGAYYQVGKRLTSTKYMLVRHWLKDRSTLPAFRLLGVVSLIHLSLHMIVAGLRFQRHSPERVMKPPSNEIVPSENRCSLCLNKRQNTSSISCGHLFCWECILPWLQEQPRCPLCRKTVQPSRVVLLQNY